MVSYTKSDVANAQKFSTANVRIRLLQKLFDKAPHLTSHLKVNIKDATDNDYYRPAALMDVCKVVDVEITKPLCELMSCNPAREQAMCTPNDHASYYYLGTDAFGIQCQPACFNVKEKKSFDPKGTVIPDTPMLIWHAEKCHYVTSPIVTLMEKPFFRSDIVYESLKNDMPTGFTRTINDDDIYGSGIGYENNEAYCNYYNLIMNDKKECVQTTGQQIVSFVAGQNVIKDIKSSIRKVFTGRAFPLPDNLPLKPESIPSQFTLSGWFSNVDDKFVVPPLIPIKMHTIDRNRHILHARHRREADYFEYMASIGGETIKEITPFIWSEILLKLIRSVIKSLVDDPKKFEQIIGMTVTPYILKQIQNLCLVIIEQLTDMLTRDFIAIAIEGIGSTVLREAMRSVCLRATVGMAIRLGSRFAIFTAEILGAASSGIGWVMIGSLLIDFVLSFWDPFGYNNMYPAELPNHLIAESEQAFRKAAQSAVIDFTFEQFAATILTNDEILQCEIESLTDTLVYLNALVVNSEGSVIDKGDLVRPTGTDAERKYVVNKALAKRYHFNPEEYKKFNKVFMVHSKIVNALSSIAIGLGIAAITMFALNMTILTIILFICMLVVFMLAQYELQHNLVTDAVLELRT